MRSIAIMGQMGTVGKTTSAVNISVALAATGKRVCVVDLDPQAHATQHLGMNLDSQHNAKSICDVLSGENTIAEVRQQVKENLWLIPAHPNMIGTELELRNVAGREFFLRDRFAEDNFPLDYLFFDCPSSLGLFTINALTTVQDIFVSLQPHYFALNGLMRLVETLEEVKKRLNKSLRLLGIILCMFDDTKLADEVLQEIVEVFGQRDKLPAVCQDAIIFDTKIRRDLQLAEAMSHGCPIFAYAPNSSGAEEYRNLAAEIGTINDSIVSDGNIGASLLPFQISSDRKRMAVAR